MEIGEVLDQKARKRILAIARVCIAKIDSFLIKTTPSG